MNNYLCNSCGYTWQAAAKPEACPRLGCGSRTFCITTAQSQEPAALREPAALQEIAVPKAPSPPRLSINVQFPAAAQQEAGLAEQQFLDGDPASATAIGVFIGLFLLLDALKWCSPWLLSQVAAKFDIANSPSNVMVIQRALTFVSSLHLVIAVLMLLPLLSRAWWTVQPAAQLGRGIRIPRPGRAVWLLLIPVFNYYWIFVAFKNLMDAANALRKARRVDCPPFGSELAGFFAGTFVAATFVYTLFWSILVVFSNETLTRTFGTQISLIHQFFRDFAPLPWLLCVVSRYICCILLIMVAGDVARITNSLRGTAANDA